MNDDSPDAYERLLELINGRAIKTGGPFNLSSGGTSDILIDLSQVLRTHDGFADLCQIVWDITDQYDAVGGPLSGSDPVAAAFMESGCKGGTIDRWFGVRKDSKHRGHDIDEITGSLVAGDKVLLVEDVCTTGGNLLRVAPIIQKAGGVISGVMVVVDRGGLARVATELGVPVKALYALKDKKVVRT